MHAHKTPSDLRGQIGTGGSFSTSALTGGVHTVMASVTDSGGLPGSDTITVTVVAGSVQVLSPVGLTGHSVSGGQNGDKHLVVTVTLDRGAGAPVSGASGSVTINGPKSGGGTVITDALGDVTFKISNAPSSIYTTTVTNVTAAGLIWDSTFPANTDSTLSNETLAQERQFRSFLIGTHINRHEILSTRREAIGHLKKYLSPGLIG